MVSILVFVPFSCSQLGFDLYFCSTWSQLPQIPVNKMVRYVMRGRPCHRFRSILTDGLHNGH